MKSVDIPQGTHVAYDRNESQSYHSFVEAFVFAVRPKGTKPQNYWGGKTGNADTIGVAYRGWGPSHETPHWGFKWTRPQNVHFTWADYEAMQKSRKDREDAQLASAAKRRKAEKAAWAALPQTVREAVKLSEWGEDEMLKKGEYANYRISVPKIQAIVDAAVKHALRNSPEAVQAEVDAALQLL